MVPTTNNNNNNNLVAKCVAAALALVFLLATLHVDSCTAQTPPSQVCVSYSFTNKVGRVASICRQLQGSFIKSTNQGCCNNLNLPATGWSFRYTTSSCSSPSRQRKVRAFCQRLGGTLTCASNTWTCAPSSVSNPSSSRSRTNLPLASASASFTPRLVSVTRTASAAAPSAAPTQLTPSLTRTPALVPTPSSTACPTLCQAFQTCVNGVCVGTGLLRVTLTWDRPGDGDLYVTTPSGGVIYWSARGPTDNGTLDVDDRTGTGPENVFWANDLTPPNGLYKVCFDTYSFSPAPAATSPVTSVVVVVKMGVVVNTFVKAFTFDTDNPGGVCDETSLGYLGSFSWP